MRLSNGTKRRDKVANRENYPKHNHVLLDLVQRVLDFNCIRLYLSSRVEMATIIFLEFMANLARSWNRSKRNYLIQTEIIHLWMNNEILIVLIK